MLLSQELTKLHSSENSEQLMELWTKQLKSAAIAGLTATKIVVTPKYYAHFELFLAESGLNKLNLKQVGTALEYTVTGWA